MQKHTTPKVLLAEDNKDALENLSLLLEIEGFAVVSAQNRLEALRQLKIDNQICLVLLEITMPVMNGWDFLRHKSGLQTIVNIPVIVLSALPLSLPPQGVQAVLQKPVYPRQLLATIHRHLT